MERSPRPLSYPRATPPEIAAVAALAGVAGVSWLVALRLTTGMDMGVATERGPFAVFVGGWVAMMAAMMLPGAIPMAARHARAGGHAGAALTFAATYVAVWAAVGLAVYPLYEPHGTVLAGATAIAAGVYELTPPKRHFRDCCREDLRSGFDYGLNCLGSSGGLMLVLLALGPMSVTWMAAVAVLVFGQKLLPPRAAIDVPVGLAIVALGALILVAPSAVPGLMPSM